MKDMIGQEVEIKDILLEINVGMQYSSLEGIAYSRMRLWEMPKEYKQEGIAYNRDKTKYTFSFASLNNSIKLNKEKLDDDFIFSFYHGMSDLKTNIKYSKNPMKLINSSDWKEVQITKKDVDTFLKLKKIKIKTKQDMFDNLDLISSSSAYPLKLVQDIFKLYKVDFTPVVNGELGLARFTDMQILSLILQTAKIQKG